MKYRFKEMQSEPLLINHLNMGGRNPQGEEINLTSRYFTRAEKPWIGIMGEFHFSRYAREDWHRELCKMKAGGITVVSAYLFWIYHEELEGEFDFTGDRDVRKFIQDCADVGLDAVIRVGPWAHGECRNGGFPDWLLKKPYKLRDNNSEYLSKVKIWFDRIYNEVQGLFYKDGGNIIAVQLENELTDGAEHLARLKEMAIESGLDAPIYTVTGWNSKFGAKIPVDEVVPVFGGYCEAPWTEHINKLPPSEHYVFNKMRNDAAIGTDVIKGGDSDGWQLPYEKYPFATCELGGGIQVTHHRRPIISGMDIYALSMVKLGSGNNLVGYYMYHGGTNKIGRLSTLNESKATGYPNDYPILSYDFQAPLSEYGEVREQYRLLNIMHMFVNDFGETLAPLVAVESLETVNAADTEKLRYAMRTDGRSGFVFVNHYQRLGELADVVDAEIDTGIVEFPPINVKGKTSFFMPFNMNLDGNTLEYATAQPICRQGDTYFFMEIEGIKPEYKFSSGTAKIVTVSLEEARYMRKLSGVVYIGGGCDLYEENGVICSVEDGVYECRRWNGERFEEFAINQPCENAGVTIQDMEQPFQPKYGEELNIGGERNVTWKKITVSSANGFAEINYTGDAAQIYADGKLVADDYYYGKAWRVPCRLLFGSECYIAISEMKDDFYREF